jgi:CHAT domain-containing protein
MIYLLFRDYSRALEMLDKAITFLKKEGAIHIESFALHLKAGVLVILGKKEKALDLFEKGITNLEKVRTNTAFSEMKRTFMESVYKQYEETVLFMLENKYYDKGFKYAEYMKARVFLDRMAEELVPLEKGLKPELRERRDKLVAKMSNISKEMHETGVNENKRSQELKQQYLQTENEFEDLLIKIRLENPLYASVRYPKPVSLPELQKKILKKGEILLRFFISPDKTYVFLISKQSFKVVPLEVKADKIKSYINRWLLAVNENSTGGMERFGKLLYRGLFKPIESKLKGSRDIFIIPDSHLEKIPFESFIIDEEKSGRPIFLLEKYRIKYIQSASLLSVLRKHYQRDRKTNNFIGFGDPVYDNDNFKQGKPEFGAPNPVRSDEITGILRGKYEREGGKLRCLPGSGDEVKTIADLYKKKNQKSVVYLRAKATEENAKSVDMKKFDYIHIACHGILGETFQCLVLSLIPGAKEDGYFTMNEIMNCDYNAKLVVLSACQTGSGKMERAEGIIGLTRAVMYAGTPAVVSSLWKVDDPATKELMVTFYRNMLEKNLDKTEALRQAKLELIKNKKYLSPLFWSAFVMYGE